MLGIGHWFILSVFCIIFEQNYSLLIENPHGVLTKTVYGTVRGKTLETPSGREFYAFLEVPYAAPPIGELRFKRPVPPRRWNGILNTTQNTKICWEVRSVKPQNDPRENEDCLYLNVYVPKYPKTKDLLPVMVYITGGAFSFNDGTFKSYKPYNFVERDVVMVSINFRQGPLGFLTTNDGVIPANVGLWDQNMALRWVQTNIRNFGGDPKKVTIMGHSSGGSCVTYHMISSKSEGLFRAAIAESGAATQHRAFQPHPKYFAYTLANAIDPKVTTQNTSEELLDFLQSVSPSVISNTTFHYEPYYENRLVAKKSLPTWWMPVIEDGGDEEAFLISHPYGAVKTGSFNKVPLLIGITSEENGNAGQSLSHDTQDAKLADVDPIQLLHGFKEVRDVEKISFWNELKKMYTRVTYQQNFTAFIKMMSDMEFSNGVTQFADLASKYTDVYFYQFSYYGPLNLDDHFDIEGLGKAAHCAELPYLVYYRLDGVTREFPESDLKMRRVISDLFANFIKYLNPTPVKDVNLQNVVWPKMTPDRLLYLDIDTNLTVKENPRSYIQFKPLHSKYYAHRIVTSEPKEIHEKST